MSLCCKAKINTPLMYEVPYKDTMKSQFLPQLSVAKRGYGSKHDRAEVIQCGLHKQKTACWWPLTSAFASCCLRCPWAARPATARAGRRKRMCFPCLCYACKYSLIAFCLVFSKDFNIMSALFVHQSPTLSQKIDSREGLFWCKIGLTCACDKMNFYLKRPPFAPVSGLFAAKWRAFWY